MRYWASAKAAAGVASDALPVDGPITLAEVIARAAALHATTRLPDVLQVCSVLLGERPVGSEEPDQVEVRPGAVVDFLPPFAGG